MTSGYFKMDTYVLLSAYDMQVDVTPAMNNRKGRKHARKYARALRKMLRATRS